MYNPLGNSQRQIEHRLAENEELIGVYGIYAADDQGKPRGWFLSFGFIIKKT